MCVKRTFEPLGAGRQLLDPVGCTRVRTRLWHRGWGVHGLPHGDTDAGDRESEGVDRCTSLFGVCYELSLEQSP